MYSSYSSGGILSLSEVNALRSEEFEWLFDNAIENNSEIAKCIASERPFTSAKNLKKSFHDYLDKLDTSGKRDVVLKYPDFIKKLVGEGSPGSESPGTATVTSEDATEDSESETMLKQKKTTLNTYNNTYQLKFHMPFVVYLKEDNEENKIEKVFESIEERLSNSTDEELNVTIEEIKKICDSRVDSLVWPDV